MNMHQEIVGGGDTSLFPEDDWAQQQQQHIRLSHPLEQYEPIPFTPKPYEVPKNIIDQHQFTRFGHTNNFQAFVKGLTHQSSSDTTTDYIVGVCAFAMLILAIALLWFMVIIGLNVAGKKKVGFLAGRLVHPDYDDDAAKSGRLPVIEEEPTSTEVEEIESNLEESGDLSTPLVINNDTTGSGLEREKRDRKFNRRVLAVRVTFALSGLMVIICGILFYSKGAASFKRSLNSMSQGLTLVQDAANGVITLTEEVVKDKDTLLTEFNQTKMDVGESLCNGDNPLARRIKEHLGDIKAEIKTVNSEVEEQIHLFNDDLRDVIKITEDINDKYIEPAEIFFGISVGLSTIVNVVVISMLVVVFFAARGVENCFTKIVTHALLWPIFSFCLVLFWIFALLFLVTSLAGSDFCVKPDQVVEGMLLQYKDEFQSLIFQFLMYWVSGCQIQARPDISSMAQPIEDFVGDLHDVSEILMNQSPVRLEDQCGLSSAAASALQGGAGLVHNATHVVNKAWIDTRHLIECKTFNPIYTTFIHDAVCKDGVDGLTWLFSSSFFLAIFAMTMIMFRAALKPAKRPPSLDGLGLSESLLSKSETS